MTPYLPYSRLKVFYHAARQGTFSKAASVLFITKGAVSQQLKDLESRLEKKLFERSSGKTVLTPDGIKLYELVAPVVEKCETIALEFQHMSGKIKGKIKIASFTGMLLYVFPNYVKTFKKLYPECDIVLFNVSGKDLRSMILSGDVDFGIGSMYELPNEILGKVRWTYDRYFIAPINHPLSKHKKLSFKEMAKYPIIMPDKDGSGGQYFAQALRRHNPDLNVTMEASSWEVVMKYVELGYGISMAPEILIQPADRKRLYTRNLSKEEPEAGYSNYGILIKKGKYHNPAARAMIKFLSPEFTDIL